ncbi:non-ribosomal peptide synthetase [Aquimarina latercula]|uniref:non-ribosomal peptide synthetase n=1 Tax=Aquimarina latercula TaxID=987 RepID=UPI0004298621|nr:non-ribosomal peptide synthetase [Aquimarina latercula]
MDKKVIHNVFEKVVSEKGNATAIEYDNKTISYDSLNSYANRVANLLNLRLVQKEDVVATLFNNDLIQIFSLLGIFKSGGIYIPLDKNYKINHWSVLYNKIKPKTAIVSPSELSVIEHYNTLYDYTIPEVIVLDINSNGELNYVVYRYYNDAYIEEFFEADLLETNVNVTVSGDDSSYIYFTSGSSGKPKAVLGNHKSLSHFIHWESKELGVTDKEKVSQLISLAFDASLRDIFLPLINGAILCLVPKDIKQEPTKLSDWIKSKEITLLHTVPTMFRLLSSSSCIERGVRCNKYPKLRNLLLAGEKLYNRDIINWREVYGNNTTIINLYGTTEATLVKSFYRVEKDLKGASSDVLCVGKPISNTVLLILNSDNELCRINEVGEIYIKTPFLSKGYLGDEEQTKEKFIQNPLNNDTDIIYKTGDYGKYDSDRNIIVQGRKDGIVKLNGVRSDLNSIESTILNLPQINMVKCMLDEETNSDSRLACFYTAKLDIDCKEEIRTHCLKYLSLYEIPSIFIHLESFPINANGKIDSIALKENLKNITINENYQSATNEKEKELIRIWEEVLAIKKIGKKDNFLFLGGNSIKLIRLKSRINKVFDVSLSIQDLFTHCVLESQAELIISSTKATYKEIKKVTESESYPISDSQRRLWILSQFEDTSKAYNMPYSLSLKGNYNVDHFKKAVSATIERHEILRTIFKEDTSGEVKQWILDSKELDFQIDYKDLREEEDALLTAKKYISKDSYQAFDLSEGPLLRASLLRVSNELYIFYFNMHHIISDGWSIGQLIKDVMHCYKAYEKDIQPNLDELKIQYKDYANWQQLQLNTDQLKKHKEYWIENLSGDLPQLNLPGQKLRPRIKTHNGRRLSTFLSTNITTELKEYCRQQEGSLFIGLLAVWNVLCYKYTSQKETIVGVPIAGRDHKDLENQIGFYVNSLALRNKMDAQESFTAFFKKVKENTLAAYDHQLYPFDRLIEDLNIKRDTSRSPIFDSMLVLHNVEDNYEIPLDKEYSRNDITDEGAVASKLDINIHFQEIGNALIFTINYNTDLYDKKSIENLINHYKELLNSILSDPELTIEELGYLKQEEINEILNNFNSTKVAYPNEKTIIDVFEEQVKIAPNKTACVYGKEKLSYTELNELSNKIASYLSLEKKIKPEDVVAIELDRGDFTLAIMLGVLKCGGTYLLLDPELPKDRIQFIIEDSSCKTFLQVDEVVKSINQSNVYNHNAPQINYSSSNLAYLIYTSGTTGKPKGVKIQHKSIVNYINWFKNANQITSNDSSIVTSSMAFDLIYTSVFGCILNGGAIHFLDKLVIKNPVEVSRYIEENKITFLKITPTYLNVLLNQVDTSNLINSKDLRLILTGGESQNLTDVQKIISETNIKLINHYGPSEGTIGVCTFEITKDNLQRFMKNPVIGHPIFNNKIFILGKNLQLQPVGVIGEICIGGEGLAKGYLNRTELTKEKFIQNPFQKEEYIYKTGDLGRWLSNGTIEFLGRKDDQVKIRGYRVELNEIESQLQSKEDVVEAVTKITTDVFGQKEVTAYVVSQKKLSTKYLRNYLLDKLPEYMMPSHFVQLDSIPQTKNGKVDKESLPDPKHIEILHQEEYIKPTNKIEERVHLFWQEVLATERISIKDNFFDLGGNSIKAIKILYKINKEFKVNINVISLFNYPTIEYLASQIKITTKQKAIQNTNKQLKEIEL